MMACTITKYLKIVSAKPTDYKNLARFHYRVGRLGPSAAMYKLIDTHPARAAMSPVVGIIIYSMPASAVQLRNVATDGLFAKLGARSMGLALVNNNVRTIARVVLEPRYRGLGLAHRLVAETMGLLKTPYIEALAVMGKVNPFFERAGMMKFIGTEPARTVKLRAGLDVLGITGRDLVDVAATDAKLSVLSSAAKNFLEPFIVGSLSAYGPRYRRLKPSVGRTEMILDKLSDRPIYYLWRNPNVKLKI